MQIERIINLLEINKIVVSFFSAGKHTLYYQVTKLSATFD